MEITAIASVDLIQRRGSSLELLKFLQFKLSLKQRLAFSLVSVLQWNPVFMGHPRNQKNCLFYQSGLEILCPSIVKKGEKIGITRFYLRVIES